MLYPISSFNINSVVKLESFEELNLSPEMTLAIEDLGFTTPSPIQKETLPILLGEPTDFIGLAATGTGKTAAFGIPLLEKIEPSKRAVQVLILVPTRELALQVTDQISALGKHKGVRALTIYGGGGYSEQIQGLRQGRPVVVGTPGRLIDHIQRGTLDLAQVETIILDEADEMISMGFKDELDAILSASADASSRKIWLFSATMSREVRRVADTYLKSPKQVQVNKVEMLSNTVEQIFYGMKESDKPEILCKLIEAADDFYGLIFCQTKSLVTDLTHFLTSRGQRVDCLHGDKEQKDREKTMQAFRDRKVSILVCTDVASRGLDVKDVTHVVNYSIPRELDNYVHRIGRTARGGKAGIAISLVTPSHRGLVGRIEKMTKSKIVEGKIPTRREIAAKKIGKLFAQFQEQKGGPRAAELLSAEWKAAIAAMPPEEIVGRFVAMTSPDLFIEREKVTRMDAPQGDARGENHYETKRRGGYQQGDREGGGGRNYRQQGGGNRYGGGGYHRRDERQGAGNTFRQEGRERAERNFAGADASQGERPSGNRPQGARPYGDRAQGARPHAGGFRRDNAGFRPGGPSKYRQGQQRTSAGPAPATGFRPGKKYARFEDLYSEAGEAKRAQSGGFERPKYQKRDKKKAAPRAKPEPTQPE